MNKTSPVIIIATVPWEHGWQRQHEWASRFASTREVLYWQPIGMTNFGPIRIIKKLLTRKRGYAFSHQLSSTQQKNLRVRQPFVIPWHSIGRINSLNAWLLERQIKKVFPSQQPLFWVCNPTDTVVSLLGKYPNAPVVYDIAMRFAKRADAPKQILNWQTELARRADLILYDARASALDLPQETLAKQHYVPQGVSEDLLEFVSADASTAAGTMLQKIQDIPHPRVGYFGLFHDAFDSRLVKAVVEKLPSVNVVLIGPGSTDLVHPRIHLVGPINRQARARVLQELDLGIIPYYVNDYTRGVFPTKLFEYLAAGLPIVSTDLPEVRRFEPRVKIARDIHEFVTQVASGIRVGRTQPDLKFLAQHTWASRFSHIEQILEPILAQ
jgi:glycosyltransferase involved in cell wall biosynthesis